jgi:hypothetical protein
MKVEGKTLSDYFKFSSRHILILVIWALLNFFFTYSKPEFGILMTKIAPIFLIIVFAHLGYKMRIKKKKFNHNSALFNGVFVGFLTGFLAGALGVSNMAQEFVMFTRVGGWTPGSGTSGLIIGIISFGIIIGILRAILGGIMTLIAFNVKK